MEKIKNCREAIMKVTGIILVKVFHGLDRVDGGRDDGRILGVF